MMRITQMPTTVTLNSKGVARTRSARRTPFNTEDIPRDVPVQVFGCMEFTHSSGEATPCWLLLGLTGVHPVDMALVGLPMTWDEEVIE